MNTPDIGPDMTDTVLVAMPRELAQWWASQDADVWALHLASDHTRICCERALPDTPKQPRPEFSHADGDR